MQDPFISPPTYLIKAVQPIADRLGLITLPLHVHEVLFAWAFYQFTFTIISPAFSRWLFPSVYARFPARTKVNWNVHVTSLIQSSFITASALFVIWSDEERRDMDWVGRIWGYTGVGGAIQGLAAGYFLWDLVASTIHLDVLGVGSLVHAFSALLVTSLGFRPFANYYGLNFILYEISTPFLNIHWFCDKLNMTGSRLQLFNGIALLATFFGGRVLWGNYQSLRIYSDVWAALKTTDIDPALVSGRSIFTYPKMAVGLEAGDVSRGLTVPTWLAIAYLGSNTVLNFLNVYWFSKMIQAMRKRFQTPSSTQKRQKISENGMNGHLE